jgi:uncharacterized protein YndB with AHSA1/START domain
VAESDFTIGAEGAQAILAERSFGADPAALIWAFLEPDTLRAWLGSPEMPLDLCEVDPQPGGRFRHAWTRPDGSRAWSAGYFRELNAERIVHSEQTRPDWSGGEMLVVKQVVPQDGGRTLLRLHMTFATPMARGQALASMAPGLRACLDRLDAVLAAPPPAA